MTGGAAAGGAGAGAGAAGGATAGVGGVTSAAGAGAASAGSGAASAMASTGGTSLLSKVALGLPAATAIAQMFQKPPNMDYNEWKGQFAAEDQAEINRLEEELKTVQTNLEVRNQAVSKLIDDFPNVMRDSIQKQREGLARSRGAFDETTKMVLDQAANQLSAKFAATGGFSSGAFNQGLANASTDVALERAGMVREDEAMLAQAEGNVGIQQYQMRLAETEALRDFQRTMLGGQIDQRQSAFQNMMQRKTGMEQTSMQMQNQERIAGRQERAGIFGSLGQLAGSYLMASSMQGKSPFGSTGGSPNMQSTSFDPNAGFASMRTSGMASRAPGGVQQYRPFRAGGGTL
jgi:hypothetical protein